MSELDLPDIAEGMRWKIKIKSAHILVCLQKKSWYGWHTVQGTRDNLRDCGLHSPEPAVLFVDGIPMSYQIEKDIKRIVLDYLDRYEEYKNNPPADFWNYDFIEALATDMCFDIVLKLEPTLEAAANYEDLANS